MAEIREPEAQALGDYDPAVPVSVIVVNWNGREHLGVCLDSLPAPDAAGRRGRVWSTTPPATARSPSCASASATPCGWSSNPRISATPAASTPASARRAAATCWRSTATPRWRPTAWHAWWRRRTAGRAPACSRPRSSRSTIATCSTMSATCSTPTASAAAAAGSSPTAASTTARRRSFCRAAAPCCCAARCSPTSGCSTPTCSPTATTPTSACAPAWRAGGAAASRSRWCSTSTRRRARRTRR